MESLGEVVKEGWSLDRKDVPLAIPGCVVMARSISSQPWENGAEVDWVLKVQETNMSVHGSGTVCFGLTLM